MRTLLVAALLLAALLCTGVPSAGATGSDRCPTGQAPLFVLGFADLKQAVGDPMGNPATCEYPDPQGTGDVEQATSTGLAFWRKSTNTPTFTDGYNHWALTADGLVTWTGDSIDPAGGAAAPSPAIASSPAASGPGPMLQARIIELTNRERTAQGLPPLREDPALDRAAQSYAQLVNATGCFSHTCPPVPDVGDRLRAAGYQPLCWGENLAEGMRTADEAVEAWMNSPGHQANILYPEFQELGVGVSYGGPYGVTYVQEFGAPAVTRR